MTRSTANKAHFSSKGLPTGRWPRRPDSHTPMSSSRSAFFSKSASLGRVLRTFSSNQSWWVSLRRSAGKEIKLHWGGQPTESANKGCNHRTSGIFWQTFWRRRSHKMLLLAFLLLGTACTPYTAPGGRLRRLAATVVSAVNEAEGFIKKLLCTRPITEIECRCSHFYLLFGFNHGFSRSSLVKGFQLSNRNPVQSPLANSRS